MRRRAPAARAGGRAAAAGRRGPRAAGSAARDTGRPPPPSAAAAGAHVRRGALPTQACGGAFDNWESASRGVRRERKIFPRVARRRDPRAPADYYGHVIAPDNKVCAWVQIDLIDARRAASRAAAPRRNPPVRRSCRRPRTRPRRRRRDDRAILKAPRRTRRPAAAPPAPRAGRCAEIVMSSTVESTGVNVPRAVLNSSGSTQARDARPPCGRMRAALAGHARYASPSPALVRAFSGG